MSEAWQYVKVHRRIWREVLTELEARARSSPVAQELLVKLESQGLRTVRSGLVTQ